MAQAQDLRCLIFIEGILYQLSEAKRDLDEAFSIATRGGMGLHLADCHLEYARLALASRGVGTLNSTSLQDAREHLAIAKKMIKKMGYHRRDKEVEELGKQMSQLPNAPMSQ